MTKYKKIMKVFSLLLCAALILTMIPLSFSASVAAASEDTRIADPSSINDWKQYFLGDVISTEKAGGIWTDKSVFTDASAFDGKVQMQDGDSNFLVALSAISANKSITGYSKVPTDTMFVLDVSRSMGANFHSGDNNNDAVEQLVEAANTAIAMLLEANNHNRVGVVVYSGTYSADVAADSSCAQVLLPLGRYEAENNEYLEKDDHLFQVGELHFMADSIKVGSQVTCEGEAVEVTEKAVFGGTYTQSGIYAAMNQFLSVEDTVVEDEAFQSGTTRVPVTVLMSDGVATSATTDYMGSGTEIGAADLGDGTTPEDELSSAIPFATQLTCAYAKERVAEHYGREGLFYTIGYNVKETPVLDPQGSDLTDSHWETYNATESGGFMQLAVRSTWISSGWWGEGHWDTEYKTIAKSDYDLSENYVDGYFSTDDLSYAFSSVTKEIISESLYYPTQVDSGNTDLDGYVVFIDDIGQYMEVKQVHGIMLGGFLFTGSNIASNFIGDGGNLGTIENPSVLGEEMISAVKERLGIANTADAQKLVDDAYNAGQLAYDPETGAYSNYIGWYADANGNYLGHGTREDAHPLEGAVYYNESYGYLGEVVDEHNESDMMHVSVQVRTKIETGETAVVFKVPASLIPVINYNVTLTGESVKDPGEITLTVDSDMEIDTDDDGISDKTVDVEPIRLLFEVGLSDEINELNVAEVVGEDYAYSENGEYAFYASRWDADSLDHATPSEAVNAVSFYEPSTDNERYYYTENSTIFRKAGEEYVPYTGADTPANSAEEFYREYAVFEVINDEETNNSIINLHYEQISEKALSVAKPGVKGGEDPSENTTWYVPKGTIHRMFANFNSGKGDFADEQHTQAQQNLTETLIYSHYLRVEETPDGNSYYADVILGNNGKLTLKQAQGVKLTTSVDITMKDTDETFSFMVASDTELSGEYRLIKADAAGHSTEETVSFESGSLEVELKAQETAYIVDLPQGITIRISELTQDKGYQVGTVNGEAAQEFASEIKANEIVTADFVNTLVSPVDSAAMVLYGVVEHPFSSDYEIPEDLMFTYTIEYSDETGVIYSEEVSLCANETKHITNIPLGAEVSVRETDMPAGFVSDAQDEVKTFTADEEKYYIVLISNVYTPEPISFNGTLTGQKTLVGRQDGEWLESDQFTFKLQKLVEATWQDMATATVTKDNRTFDFSSALCEESYGAVGTYSYRVVEVIEENPSQGVTFDKSVRWFDVSVTDRDMDGSYEIRRVTPYGGTIVTHKDGDESWHIEANFANTYSSAGSDSVKVTVRNNIVNNSSAQTEESTLSAAGYEYGIYQNDRLVTVLPATNEAGETAITFTYGAFDIGKHIHYVLRQISPEEPLEGMEYSTQEYNIVVEVEDDAVGGVKAHLTVKESGSDAPESSGDEVEVAFTNIYSKTEEPDPTEPDPTDPDPTEPDVTEPDSKDPSVTDPDVTGTETTEPTSTEETVIPEPSQDATGSKDETNQGGVSDVPQTGFLETVNIALWIVFAVIVVAGVLGAIFIGRKK